MLDNQMPISNSAGLKSRSPISHRRVVNSIPGQHIWVIGGGKLTM